MIKTKSYPKLTPEKRDIIKKEWKTLGLSDTELANKHGISISTVRKLGDECLTEYKVFGEEYINRTLPKVTPLVPVKQYSLNDEYIQTWNDIRDAAEVYNRKPEQIRRCCRGQTAHFAKFKWKYATDKNQDTKQPNQ